MAGSERREPPGPVRAVFFDVGETLADETRQWSGWADWLGVRPHAFFALLGSVIERGEQHVRALELVRPGFDLDAEEAARREAGERLELELGDLYPDALPCLRALRGEGYRLGLVGNQPEATERFLRSLDVAVDVVGSSAAWGVSKPSPAFFERVVDAAALAPRQVAYVGDRLDNDVLPALEAGLVAVFLRRGPWGLVHARRPEAARAHVVLDSLLDLPEALRSLPDRGAAS